MENYRKLPVLSIYSKALADFKNNFFAMLLFSTLNYVSVILGVYTWRTPKFFVVLFFAYILWCYFFRFCFDKKPYLNFKSTFASVAPSTKILVLSFVIMTILVLFPFALPFLGLGNTDGYLRFLNDKQMLDTILSVISLFIAPFIFFRPFFAWIASVLGNNKSLKFAFYHTKGNYWSIVCLLLILNIPYMIIEQGCQFLSVPDWGKYALLSPLIVYANLIMAKCYEYFFLEK